MYHPEEAVSLHQHQRSIQHRHAVAIHTEAKVGVRSTTELRILDLSIRRRVMHQAQGTAVGTTDRTIHPRIRVEDMFVHTQSQRQHPKNLLTEPDHGIIVRARYSPEARDVDFGRVLVPRTLRVFAYVERLFQIWGCIWIELLLCETRISCYAQSLTDPRYNELLTPILRTVGKMHVKLCSRWESVEVSSHSENFAL
jgi:hypothetical protein